MTSTVLLANKSVSISTRAARLAIGATTAYQILLIVLIFLRPDLDPSWHTVSEWAIGPHGWMMSTAFFISALSYVTLFLMLKSQLRGILGTMPGAPLKVSDPRIHRLRDSSLLGNRLV
jgi:archaellum biogenesis protein FlaJ (TadC family)